MATETLTSDDALAAFRMFLRGDLSADTLRERYHVSVSLAEDFDPKHFERIAERFRWWARYAYAETISQPKERTAALKRVGEELAWYGVDVKLAGSPE